MAVTLTGTGGLFKRLGRLFGGLLDLDALRGGTATARVLSTANFNTRRNNIFADYAEGTAINDIVSGLEANLVALKNGQNSWFTAMKSLAEATVIKMVDDDTALATKTVGEALRILILQMIDNSDSVNASAPSAGSQTDMTGVTPVGNPKIISSVTAGDGTLLEYAFAETVEFAITNDSKGANTATAQNEPFSMKGEISANYQSEEYPLGSSGSKTGKLVDPSGNNARGQKLVNGDFEDFTTTDIADNWDIEVGTATTTIAEDASNFYAGTSSLSFIGDGGGTLSAVSQQFNKASSATANAGGTPYKLKPLVPYAISLWSRVSAAPAAGVARISFHDGSSVINDEAGTANSFTVDLTGESTSWAFHSGVFRLPANIPSTVNIKIELTTAIDNTKVWNFDDVIVSEMIQLYPGGPFFALHSAATDPVIGDGWTVAISNTDGAIQRQMDRVFGMRALGLQLPSHSGGSETISDSLVA